MRTIIISAVHLVCGMYAIDDLCGNYLFFLLCHERMARELI